MSESFIQRGVLTKWLHGLEDTRIIIGKPVIDKDGLFLAIVKFSNVKKYDAKIKGADEFNAIECAIRYVDGICKNSTDPEFLSLDDESLLI